MTKLEPESPQLLALGEKWIVVNKPANWLTIVGRPASSRLNDLSVSKSPSKPGVQPNVLSEWVKQNFGPCWIVHRLDLPTSGVVLFARSAQSHKEANDWFEQRKVKKTYLCLASGQTSLPTWSIRTPVAGKMSLTQIEVMEQFSSAFYARVRILTGRRHQIRIHLSEMGHALLGDEAYGGPRKMDSGASLTRVALHASLLELPSGEKFEAPLPQDFEMWLDALRFKSDSGKELK